MLREPSHHAETLPYLSRGRPLFSIATTVGLWPAAARPLVALVALLPGRPGEWTSAYREHLAVGEGGEAATLWLLRPSFAYGQDLDALTAMVRRLRAAAHPGFDTPTDLGFLDGSLYLGWSGSAIGLTEKLAHSPRCGPRAVGAIFAELATGLDQASTLGLTHGFLSAREICVSRGGRAMLRGCALLPPVAVAGQPRADDYLGFAQVLAGMVLGKLHLPAQVAHARIRRRHPRLMMLQSALLGTVRADFASLTHELMES